MKCNENGLTFTQWCDAARISLDDINSALKETARFAWEKGEDPSDYAATPDYAATKSQTNLDKQIRVGQLILVRTEDPGIWREGRVTDIGYSFVTVEFRVKLAGQKAYDMKSTFDFTDRFESHEMWTFGDKITP